MKQREQAPEIGPRLQEIRKRKRLSLSDLEARSGVSRSMLSQIERGTANPTFATLWNLTRALDLDISELLGTPRDAPPIDLVPADKIPEMRTQDGLCVLRILNPMKAAPFVEWYELVIAPGGALLSKPHTTGTVEHLTVLSGTLKVRAGDNEVIANAGATARYAVDVQHSISNAGAKNARALLVVVPSRPSS